MTKQEFHTRIWAKLADYNRIWRLVRPGDRILVGVSGGPDSVCLVHFLYKLSQRMKIPLHLLHLHHGLRGRAADQDARFVRKLGTALGLPVSTRRIPVAAFARKNRRSLEDAGRVLRYRAFAAGARKIGCNKVATGHQTDDVAETLLLHLLRGSRAEGLAGIPPRRSLAPGRGSDETIQVIRPLLCLSRKEVLEYLRYNSLAFRTDRSNLAIRFTRNWVRRKVLPLLESRNPSIRGNLARIARDLEIKLKASARRQR